MCNVLKTYDVVGWNNTLISIIRNDFRLLSLDHELDIFIISFLLHVMEIYNRKKEILSRKFRISI